MNIISNRIVADQVKNKDAYTLNINDDMAKLCIQNSKEKIAEINISIEKFTPDYEDKKRLYEDVRKEFDEVDRQMQNLKDGIKAQEDVIKMLTGFMRNENRNKTLNVMVNREEKPVKISGYVKSVNKPMNVSWLNECEIVFQEEKRFLSSEELWNCFSKKPELIERCNKNVTKFPAMKTIALDGIIKHALRFTGQPRKNGDKRKHQVLGIYKEKIGLAAWLTADGTPTGDHIKEFMFQDYAEGRHPQDVRIRKIVAHVRRKAS